MKLHILAPLAVLSLVAAPSIAATKKPAKHMKMAKTKSKTMTTTTAKPKSSM